MSEPATSPYLRGFHIALEGMKLAFRSPEVGRAYVRVSLVIFSLGLLLAGISILALWSNTEPAADAESWLIALLWAARVVGSLASLVLGPLMAIYIVNIAFPFFNQGVFMAGLRAVDPKRAAGLEDKPGMSLGLAVSLALWRFLKFMFLG